MIELFQKILSVIMSLFVWLGVPFEITNTVTTADEDWGIVDPNHDVPSSDTEFFLNNPSFWLTYEIKDQKAYITGAKQVWVSWDGWAFRAPDPLVFPETIEGYPVVSIGGFIGHDKYNDMYYSDFDRRFSSIIIPDTVETVEEEAFMLIDTDTIFIGKNVKVLENGCFETDNVKLIAGKTVKSIGGFYINNGVFCCYENSELHKYVTKKNRSDWSIVLIDESHLTSKTATIDEELNVRGLPSGLTKETVKDYVSVDGDAIMEISDDVITTGTTIELINREYGLIDNTYTVIIDGDINGDGAAVSAEDFTAMRDIITGSDSEYSDINKKAADLNGDGIVNSTDLTIMKSLLN